MEYSVYVYEIHLVWHVPWEKNCPFLLDSQISWHIQLFLVFSDYCIFLHYQLRFIVSHLLLFFNLGPHSLLLVHLARCISGLFTHSESQLLIVMIFFCCFWIPTVFIPSLICRPYYFLPSADLRICLYFSFFFFFGGSLSYCFEMFFFVEEGLHHYDLPSKNAFWGIPSLLNGVFSLSFVSSYF